MKSRYFFLEFVAKANPVRKSFMLLAGGNWNIVRQYDGFRFDLQGLMLRQNIELVDPVANASRYDVRAMRDS